MSNVWLVIQDNSLPEHGSLSRHFYFAKHLQNHGYHPVVFVASKARCSSKQMIEDGKPYLVDDSYGFPWVYIQTNDYGDNLKRRILAIIEYHARINHHSRFFASAFGAPDIILGSVGYPFTPALGLMLAKRFESACVMEIRDLWPDSPERYGVIKENGVIARMLYRAMRHLYEKSDAVIFTMEGGIRYIADKSWDSAHGGKVDLDKCFYVNNGVDLDLFESNLLAHPYSNKLLSSSHKKKVCYAGSIRKMNNVGFFVDVAHYLTRKGVDLFILGDGEELPDLIAKANESRIENIHFLGAVEKTLIPSALSQMDLLVMSYSPKQRVLSQYGMSQNKLFEYLASGKPILSNLPSEYSVIRRFGCGVEAEFASAEECANTILDLLSDEDRLRRYGENAGRAAEEFSYARLTKKMINAIEYAKDNSRWSHAAKDRCVC